MANEGVIWCHTRNQVEGYLGDTYLQMGYNRLSLLGPVEVTKKITELRRADIWVDSI